jgi:tetratricopeptide (TPR) repeat protein
LGAGTYCVAMAPSDVAPLIDRGQRVLDGPDEGAWFDELDANRSAVEDHVRSVLAGVDGGAIATLGARLWAYWVRRANDGSDWLERAVGATEATSAPPSEDLAVLLYGAGLAAFRHGDNERCRELSERALRVAERVGSDVGRNRALVGLSRAAFRDHDFTRGIDYAASAGTIAIAADDRNGEILAMHMEAELRRAAGDYSAAAPLYEGLLELDREANAQRAIAMELYNLGSVLLQVGDLNRADSCLRESLRVAIQVHAADLVPYSLLGLAGLAARRGDAVTAGRLLGAVEAHFESEGELLDPAEQIELASHKTAGEAADQTAFTAAHAAGRSTSVASVAREL